MISTAWNIFVVYIMLLTFRSKANRFLYEPQGHLSLNISLILIESTDSKNLYKQINTYQQHNIERK